MRAIVENSIEEGETSFKEGSPRKDSVDVRPPNAPWVPLKPGASGRSALAFYYSDSNSSIPVREVTRADDNKADPNIETKTFGLFSTCERGMRAGVVREGMEYVFFCTRRADLRVLTGYYKVGWYCEGPLIKGYRLGNEPPKDFILAASEYRFVNPGFPLRGLTPLLRGTSLDTPFRTYRYLEKDASQILVKLLQQTPDATEEYLQEVRRLEESNLEEYGYRYKNWRRESGFSWELAPLYLGLEE